MGIAFPLSSEALLTLFGGVVVAAIAGLWLKHYLSDWRYTPLLVLGVTELVLLLVLFATTGWRPEAEQIIAVAAIGVFGASLESWGYEAIVNVIGKMGFGPRSDERQLDKAIDTLAKSGWRAEPPINPK